MSRPDLLLPKPVPEAARMVLDREFSVAELWRAPNRDALIADIAPRCRFAVSSGGLRFDDALLDRLPRLEIIANFGVGYDSIDTRACARRGIVATNTPDVLNDEVADTTIALLLAALKHLPAADRFVREGRWPDGPFPLSPTLIGRMVGIVGLGRIGLTIAKRLEAFAIRGIAYHSRSPKPGVPYAYYASLVDLARDCDVLIVITPGGEATRHLISRAVMEALGPGGLIVNMARGTVVDEEALIACLSTGRLGMAALDVFEREPRVPEALRALPNVVLAPHIGSATHHTRDAMGLLMAENLVAWKEGRPPMTPVPETPVPAFIPRAAP